MSDSARPDNRHLHRWERFGLVLLLVAVTAFGGLVLVRSAFQQSRKTDFGVYARAGHAVRTGLDLYAVTDDNAWHYCYPPPFAVLMVPLADPPAWESRGGYLPFWVSVVVWYAVSVLLTWRTVHVLAAAALPDTAPRTRRWWYARLVPLYVCVGGIGYTLSRGQVNILLLWLVAELFAATMRGRTVVAGLWLAAAVALKVIPGFLSLFHLVRGEWKAAIGLLAGSFILLGVVPSAIWGPTGAVELNRTMLRVVLAPGAVGEGDQTRAKELTGATATDSQSFQAVFHNWQHPDPRTRPTEFAPTTRLAHWAVGGLLTVVTVAAGWVGGNRSPTTALVFLGMLTAVMALLTPVSHMHYYAFGLPLVAGLWLDQLRRHPGAALVGGPVVGAVIVWGVLTALPLLPDRPFALAREMGLGTFSTVGLWTVGVVELLRGRCEQMPGRPAADRRAS